MKQSNPKTPASAPRPDRRDVRPPKTVPLAVPAKDAPVAARGDDDLMSTPS